MMALKNLDGVIEKYEGLERKALDYTQTMKNLIDASNNLVSHPRIGLR